MSEGLGVSTAIDAIDAIDAVLPQTQCTRCGYPDCRGYAEAIAQDAAPINRCPPGGAEGVLRLARVTGRAAQPLDPAHGVEAPIRLAVIDEEWCIGCTLCLDACPVDAIVGASKQMHTVLDGACTGCELCVPVCPVDCISLAEPLSDLTGWDAWSDARAREARERHAFHQLRASRKADEQRLALADRTRQALDAAAARSRASAALERARTRRGS